MGGRLDGRVAVVTGAGNGIGQACAMALGANGASVVVNDLGTDEFGTGRASAAADATVAAIREAGGDATANYDSVADSAGVHALVQTAIDAYGKVDIVVGCAGAVMPAGIDSTDEQYQRFIDLFLSQKFWLARETIPAMVERGWGRFIATTSHGATGMLGQPIFAAAMGGVISLTKAIAHEHRGTGVTANCLAPGAATRLHRLSHDQFVAMRDQGIISEEDWERYLHTPPPEYVAPIVAWLCTDKAADVSGHVLHAAGNLVGRWSAYTDDRVLYRGDHRTTEPWPLEELDELVPSVLFAE